MSKKQAAEGLFVVLDKVTWQVLTLLQNLFVVLDKVTWQVLTLLH